jgi:dephospho-CoA kinase
MPLFGVTGGIGMGKSVSTGILESLGIPTVDTAVLARSEVEPGTPACEEIRSAFGSDFVDSGGRLDRARLAALVFSDSSARNRLEEILHPRITRAWRASVADWRQRNLSGAVVIPLLFEKAYENEFDAVVCVACSRETQDARLRERGWNDAHIEARKSTQWPVADKINRSGFVVWTEGSLASHRRQWERILETQSSRNSATKAE